MTRKHRCTLDAYMNDLHCFTLPSRLDALRLRKGEVPDLADATVSVLGNTSEPASSSVPTSAEPAKAHNAEKMEEEDSGSDSSSEEDAPEPKPVKRNPKEIRERNRAIYREKYSKAKPKPSAAESAPVPPHARPPLPEEPMKSEPPPEPPAAPSMTIPVASVPMQSNPPPVQQPQSAPIVIPTVMPNNSPPPSSSTGVVPPIQVVQAPPGFDSYAQFRQPDGSLVFPPGFEHLAPGAQQAQAAPQPINSTYAAQQAAAAAQEAARAAQAAAKAASQSRRTKSVYSLSDNDDDTLSISSLSDNEVRRIERKRKGSVFRDKRPSKKQRFSRGIFDDFIFRKRKKQ